MNLERRDDLALLRMRAGRANAINLDLLAALDAALDVFEESNARALVVTGEGRTFCSGLDLPELLRLDRTGVRALMDALHRVLLRLFRLPAPVVAAVNGHAIAGGCALAQAADLRILRRGDFQVGLNETQLGIGLPAIVVETLRSHVPAISHVPVALRGGLFAPDEAVRLGLGDEVADDVEAWALDRARALTQVPAGAYAQVKAGLRAPFVERAEASHAAAIEPWLDCCFSPAARERIGAVVDRLSRP
jgi:enoyl-CoA hydratase